MAQFVNDFVRCQACMVRDEHRLRLKFVSINAGEPAGWKLRPHASSRLWTNFSRLAPVVQRPDNFIQWIRHFCAKILVFPLVQANNHTLTTAKVWECMKTVDNV